MWAPSSRRLEELSEVFGGVVWRSHILFRLKVSAPLKYFFQAVKTLIFLTSEKPDVVVAQNPPIFAPLTCLVYARLTRRTIWIDHHCVWSEKNVRQPFLREFVRLIEAVCCRNADLNTAPNEFWAAEIKKLGGEAEALAMVDFVNKSWL